MHSDPSTHRLRSALAAARHRCTSPKNPDYRYYGARGIRICAQWLEDPASFVAWAHANGYRHGLYLDRIDTAKNYEPANCRWVTPLESTRNRRSTILVEHEGETKALIDWAMQHKLTHKCIYQRYSKGIRPPELFAPSRRLSAHKPCRVAANKRRPNKRGLSAL